MAKNFNSVTFPGITDAYVVNQIAAEFSTSTSYAVGDYCNYLGQIYKCTTAHSGAWDASDFTAVYIADEVANTTSAAELSSDLKTALLQIAEKVAYIDANGQDYYDDLYEALYDTKWTITYSLTNCSASNIASQVTKEAAYATTIAAATGYTLTGATVSVTMGGTDVTASVYSGGVITIATVTGNVVITVSAAALAVSSISAVYTQSGTVYDTDSLSDLTGDLVVTATYSDSSTATLSSSYYTLSGTLSEGTSTVTVSYGGCTDTFTVTVTANPAIVVNWDYTMGLPTDNGFTKTSSGTYTETLESDDVKLTATGTSSSFDTGLNIDYVYSTNSLTAADVTVNFKTGSSNYFVLIIRLCGLFSLRVQYSSSYKGFYLGDASAIASMTKIATAATDTTYTVRIVVANGYADVYIDGTLVTSQYDIANIVMYKGFTGLGFGSTGTGTGTCYLYSTSMQLTEATS